MGGGSSLSVIGMVSHFEEGEERRGGRGLGGRRAEGWRGGVVEFYSFFWSWKQPSRYQNEGYERIAKSSLKAIWQAGST